MYSVPDETSSIIMEIERGMKIKILQAGDNWCKISYENIEGWVPSKNFARI